MGSTTVRLETKTRDGLEALKAHRRESFDEVISKLLALVPEGDEEGRYSDGFRAGLLDSLLDARGGKHISLEKLKKGIGL